MKTNYNRTVQACFIGYVVQAIVNNFVPLLFLTFQGSYGISLQKITLLVTFNFGIQLLVDLASIGFVDRIGYRASMILAHAMAAAGLILLTVLPECLGDPFVGLLIAVMIYAIGGGLLEVLVSPVVEACPTDNESPSFLLLLGTCGSGTSFYIILSYFRDCKLEIYGAGVGIDSHCKWNPFYQSTYCSIARRRRNRSYNGGTF